MRLGLSRMPAPLKDMGSASELQGQNPHREPKMTLDEFRESLTATEPPAGPHARPRRTVVRW